MAQRFCIEAFQQKLKTSEIGKEIVYLDVTGSTMDDARKFGVSEAERYPHGTVIMAERQTKARGARDHKWDASNTGNIYVSIILHMPQSYKTFEGKFDIEVAACVAVWSVVRKLGISDVVPKWPNDLWIRGHKLAGFLSEDSRFDIPDSNQCLMILGIGINVNADIRQNPDLNSIATSLMCERNGEPVNREDFLADVCSALEESLTSRSDNLRQFRTNNLFEKGCDISVTSPSQGIVIDGEFVEVCDNWDVRFIDKRTSEVLQGRSDYYTVRPKVQRKILVVFSGTSNASKPAAVVASKLTAFVDTSQFVVCSVPESAITQSETWMKTCALLVLAEDVCDSTHVTSKLKSYLKSGGNLLTAGTASCFAAKTFEIQYKEGVLESLADNTDFSMLSVAVESGLDSINGDQTRPASSPHTVSFPSSLIYCKFIKDFYASNSLTAQMKDVSIRSHDDCPENSDASQGDKIHVAFNYCPCEDEEYCVSVLTCPTTHGGTIALFGFSIGTVTPSLFPLIEDIAEKKDEQLTGVEKVIRELHRDRFERGKLLSQVLKVLKVT